MEREHEAQVFGYGRNFFHFESSALFAAAIEATLKLSARISQINNDFSTR
jgi:hypothetical protein